MARKKPGTQKVGAPTIKTPRKIAIYALVDPDTSEVRYIGKSVNAQGRFKQHLSEKRRGKAPIYCWIRSLKERGLVPQMMILHICDETNWEVIERAEIAAARDRGLRLLNVA